MNEDKTVELLREVYNIFSPQNGVERDVFNQIGKHLEQIDIAKRYEDDFEEDTRRDRKKNLKLRGTIEERSD